MTDEKKTEPTDPAGLVENAFLLGIGVLELTREKTQSFAAELIDRGKMSQSEAKRVADKLGTIAQEQQENMRRTVAAETEKLMANGGVATKSEVSSLRDEIAELKAMIASLKPESSEDPSA